MKVPVSRAAPFAGAADEWLRSFPHSECKFVRKFEEVLRGRERGRCAGLVVVVEVVGLRVRARRW